MALLLFAGAAAISTANFNHVEKATESSSDAPQLTLDYRGDDPAVFQYRDVAIGDVILGNPGLEIVRAGNHSSPTWGNVSVSRFDEVAGFQNLTGIEHFWQEYFRVETGQMRAGGPDEIVAAGKWSGDGGTSYQANVRIINATPPASQIASASYGTGSSYFWALAVADVDLDGEVELVGVGEKVIAPGNEQGFVVVANLSGGAIINEFNQLFTGGGPGVLRYWSVDVADVAGGPEPEIVIAGDHNGAAFVQIASFLGGTWNQLENITYRTNQSSTVYMVKVADVDGNLQNDIVAVGKERDTSTGTNYSRVTVLTWDGGPSRIIFKGNRTWTGANDDASAYDVVLEDFDPSPGAEITTIGYNRNGTQPAELWGELNMMNGSLAELTKMQWNGSDIDHWGAASGDVDGDGKLEIVSVGMKGVSGIWEGQTQVTEVAEFGPAGHLWAVAISIAFLVLAPRISTAHHRGRRRGGERGGSLLRVGQF